MQQWLTITWLAAASLMPLAVPLVHGAEQRTLRVATFNVSMEGDNYVVKGETPRGDELFLNLANGNHPQLRAIARIIQTVRPDILLLNEFDYTADAALGVDAFQSNYLSVAQEGTEAITYPFAFTAPVNTGIDSGFDLNGDGVASGRGQDAWGYGLYPGQYGMVILSRYPIDADTARTFRRFRWLDMPGNLLASMRTPNDETWYPLAAVKQFPLSSKSHWDVPVTVGKNTVHILASHPTPPVFDGPEDRNGRRNHDEIRFWTDYVSNAEGSDYAYDDAGRRGGFAGERFVILGDLNASAVDGEALRAGIGDLLANPAVNDDFTPESLGARLAQPDHTQSAAHTASWGMRADYALPSRSGFEIHGGGVFWPAPEEAGAELVASRSISSDHRLVWVDLVIVEAPPANNR